MSEIPEVPEHAENKPFNLGTVIADAKAVITNPVEFFRAMPTSGGYADPLIFVAVIAAVCGLMIAVLGIIGLSPSAQFAGFAALSAVIIFPIFGVLGSFIGAAIMFVVWKLMGSEKNYETAYRCVAYSWAIAPVVLILSVIPYLGGIIKTLWGTFLMYTASLEVHKLKQQTAKIVFAVLAVIGVLWGINAERTMRNFEARFERVAERTKMPEAFKDLENLEDLTPEEAGKQVGEFLKGLQEFSEGIEEATKAEEKAGGNN